MQLYKLPSATMSKIAVKGGSTLAILLGLTLSSLSQGAIYKVTDSDGRVTFTDTPEAKADVESVDLKKINTIPRPQSDQDNKRADNDDTALTASKPDQPAEFVNYQVKLTSPESGYVYHRPAQSVRVSASIEPNLAPNHSVQLKVDGNIIGTGSSAIIATTELNPGNHTATVEVLDRNGGVLTSQSTSFTVIITSAAIKKFQREQMLARQQKKPWWKFF